MVLAQSPEFDVVGDADDTTAAAPAPVVDVVLLSGVAPETGALATLARVRATNAHAATVMLVEGATPSFVTSAHAAGVGAMLHENVDRQQLIDAMVAVHRGQRVFDPPFAADPPRSARLAERSRARRASARGRRCVAARHQPHLEYFQVHDADVSFRRDPQDGRAESGRCGARGARPGLAVAGRSRA